MLISKKMCNRISAEEIYKSCKNIRFSKIFDNDGSDSKKSEKEKIDDGLNFDHYLAGSSIGFSTSILLITAFVWILDFLEIAMTIPIKFMINILPTFLGSALGSFLLIEKKHSDYILDGIKIGLGGFIITFIYTSIMGESVGSFYIFFGYIIGGIFGGMTAHR